MTHPRLIDTFVIRVCTVEMGPLGTSKSYLVTKEK